MNIRTLASRGMLAIACCCMGAAYAAAPVLPDALLACRNESDDGRRLQCFDREIANFQAAQVRNFGLNPSKLTAGAAPAPNRVAPAAAVSGDSPAPPAPPAPPARPTDVAAVSAKLVALRDQPHAGFIATLDNGQVWVQNEMEPSRRIKVGDTVTIKPARMGGYWFEGPSGWATKAHRVQ